MVILITTSPLGESKPRATAARERASRARFEFGGESCVEGVWRGREPAYGDSVAPSAVFDFEEEHR